MLQVFYELTPNVYTEMQTVRYQGFEVGTSCNQGNPHTGKVPFDDPGGTLDIKGWRKIRVYETDATPTLLWSGRIHNKTVRRGDTERGSLRTGADRWWDCDAADQNTLIPSRVIRGTSANRPAESAGERLDWLINHTSFTIFVDNGHITYPSDRLDASDYTGQTPANVFEDCAMPGGYVYFALQVDDTDFPELFFMKPDSSDWASSVSLSDDSADVDNSTVFAPMYDAAIEIIDEQVAAGVFEPYAGGDGSAYVYVSDSDIGDEFAFVDKAVTQANVKTAAKATVIAERHLAASSTEAEKITCSVLVPASMANAIRPWHRIAYKSTWMPNFQEYRDCRVLDWAITQHPWPGSGGGDGYKIDLELSPIDVVDPASCSVAIAAAVTNTDTGLESGGATASVSLTAPDDGYVVGILYAANGNTPNAENMGTPSGYTTIDSEPDYGRATWFMGYKAASGGSVGMSASWTPGFANAGVWEAGLAWLPWSSLTVVQAIGPGTGIGGDMVFDDPPTPGNTILMFATTYHNTPGVPFTLGGTYGPSTGWTELFDPGDVQVIGIGGVGAHVALYARCVQEGDGVDYGFSYTGMQPTQAYGYIVEVAT